VAEAKGGGRERTGGVHGAAAGIVLLAFAAVGFICWASNDSDGYLKSSVSTHILRLIKKTRFRDGADRRK